MEQVKEFIETLWKLSADQIALISLAVTFLLFVLGKRAENRIKIYETRKEEYKKLINFFLEIFTYTGEDISKLTKDDETKKRFLDMGASLAIYGSKKLYKTYYFYRWISLDEKVQSSRWYSKDMGMYCLGEMFQIMRREIGLNDELFKVDVPDVLSFYIIDFTKPEFKKNFYKYHFRKFLLKSAIFWSKVEDLLPLVWISNYLIKPLFLILFCVVRFPIKLLIITPIKQIKKRRSK